MTDYISKKGIQKALIDLPVDLDAKTVQRCIEAVHNFPAADVRENVRGEWIDCDVNESGLENTVSLLCNNCGNYTEFALVGTPKEVMDTMRFCPRCGAPTQEDEP